MNELDAFVLKTCQTHPLVRDGYHRHWTALRPGIGDMQFLLESLHDEVRARRAWIGSSEFTRRIEGVLEEAESYLAEVKRSSDELSVPTVRYQRELYSRLDFLTNILQ